jgi:NADPH-dependent 2,4-dienoyl-CoA reductase/sulfur reductase-like enzyme/rhodanese-related sulfurtransferase
VEGRDLDGVFSLTRLEAAEAIRAACRNGAVNNAVVAGGGFIGLEAAVALSDMWGVKVSVVEMADHLLPGVLSPDLARMASHDCARHNVDVYAAESVVRLTGKGGAVKSLVTERRELPCEIVIFAAGFIPNGDLAKSAGLAVTPSGAVVVDKYMRTSDTSIYAGGDCVSVKNIITGKNGYLPLGSMANRQGRVIGTNLAGGSAIFPGYVGTWAVKLFDLSFCGAGLTVENARKEGFDAVGVSVEQFDRAHFYPEKGMMSLTLVADRNDGRVIGIQGAGPAGDALKARIDAVAGVLQYARPVVEDISNLEVGYAPPFASAMDIVNAVANVTENVLAGRFKPVTADSFMELWSGRDKNRVFFIDARPAAAGKAVEATRPDWHAIPLEEIRARVAEIPRDRPVAVICNTGLRSYDSVLVLARHGITDVVNAMGGMQAALKMGLQP